MCDGTDEMDALAKLLAAIQTFNDRVDTTRRSGAEIADRLIQLRHGIDLLELAFAVDAAEFAATDEYDVRGSRTPIDWVRLNCNLSGSAAGRAVTLGEQLSVLPQSVHALQQGRIGAAHLAMMASNARAVRDHAGLTEIPFKEAPLLALAEEHSVGKFGFDCAHARHVADAAAALEEHVTAVERRRLELIPCDGGMLAMRGFFDPVAGAVIQTALVAASKPTSEADGRPLERRLANSLVEIVSNALDVGAVPDTASQRTHLVVTASLETVMGLEGAPGGDLEHGGVIPAATVQRLACDASIRRIVFGPDSSIVDVGRLLRVPSGATRDMLRLRDKGCVWPGCSRTASMTVAHHLVHWAHGGATDAKNLVLICLRHHWLAHEGGWKLVRADDGRILTIPPTPGYRSWIRAPGRAGVT